MSSKYKNEVKNTDNRNGVIQQNINININKFRISIGGVKRFIYKKVQSKKYYVNLENLLNRQLVTKLEQFKSNHKYIPEVFLELNDVKENLRYLVQPVLFYNKNINEIDKVTFESLNETLDTLGLETYELKIDKNLLNAKTLQDVSLNTNLILNYFSKFKKDLPIVRGKREEIEKSLSEEQYKLFVVNETIYDRYKWFLDDFQKDFELLNKSLILLTEKAGQGKTNLICDFVDNVILKKDLPCVMFTGNEFNNLNQEQIEEMILRNIYNFDNQDITFEEFLIDMETLCSKKNTTFTIIIDGLNENSDIENFSKKLYSFTEKILNKPFIRLIYTCRSEYFNQRFKIFNNPTFDKKMLTLDNYMDMYHRYNKKELPEYLEKRLIDSYFKYFQVKNSVFYNVQKVLVNDFLLLRIFCEVYGQKTNPNAPTVQIYDIYKDKLFKYYFDFKQEQINNISPYSVSDFKKLFNEILKFMVEKNQYINIPFEELESINKDLLNHIVDADIFFRKDLIYDELNVFANKEVLNFTFDEFRDFLVANYLVSNKIDIKNFLEAQTSNNTVIEGIEKYLFFKSRQNLYRDKLSFLEGYVNFNSLFIQNIFSVDDNDIDISDIEKIKELFHLDFDYAKYIIEILMYRHHTKEYKNLNIFTLFEIIISLTDEEYDKIINKNFKIKHDPYGYHPFESRKGKILSMMKQLEDILEKRDCNQEYQLHNIFEFMFLLLGIEDEEEYGSVPYELVELLEKYIDKYKEYSKKILLKYHDIKIEKVRIEIWKLFNFHIENEIDFDKEFCQKIFNEYIELDEGLLKNQQEYFLRTIYSNKSDFFNKEQIDHFELLIKKDEEHRVSIFKYIDGTYKDIESLYEDIEI